MQPMAGAYSVGHLGRHNPSGANTQWRRFLVRARKPHLQKHYGSGYRLSRDVYALLAPWIPVEIWPSPLGLASSS